MDAASIQNYIQGGDINYEGAKFTVSEILCISLALS